MTWSDRLERGRGSRPRRDRACGHGRRRVECRKGPPVHTAVGGDECDGPPVAEHGVVLQGREPLDPLGGAHGRSVPVSCGDSGPGAVARRRTCGRRGLAHQRTERDDDGQAHHQADEGSARLGEPGGDEECRGGRGRVVRAGQLQDEHRHADRRGRRGHLVYEGPPLADRRVPDEPERSQGAEPAGDGDPVADQGVAEPGASVPGWAAKT